MRSRLAIALLSLALFARAESPAAAASATNSLPPADEVIRRLIERAAQDAPHQRGAHVFYRTNITEEFDSQGGLATREELLLRVTVRNGEHEVELLELNGRPPTAKERMRELKRFNQQPREGPAKRERPDRSRTLEAYFTEELLGRYEFTVAGRETIADRPCLRVEFRPGRAGSGSNKLFDRVLDRLGGVFWIDEIDHQLAGADLELLEKVSLWGGLLGNLEQMHLQIARTRDQEGQWRDHAIEARFVGRAVARQINVRTRDLSSTPEPLVTEVVAAE